MPEALARLHAAAFPGERGWSAAEFAALIGAPGAALAGDETCFVLGRVTLDEAEILTLATDPAHRREGRARAALAAFERAAAAQGARRVLLEVAADNAAARGLYDAAGYAVAGTRRGYYARAGRPAMDALLLVKHLPPIRSDDR